MTGAIASACPDVDLGLSDSIRDYWPQSKPLDLESIDYETWRDEHRDWFASEFPWIFEAQKVLQERHGIDADYIELLMISGDIWQFNYSRAWHQPIPVFNAAVIKRIASHYGADLATLLDAVVANAPNTEAFLADQPLTGAVNEYRSALQRWQSDIANLTKAGEGNTVSKGSQHVKSNVLISTWRAATYLSNTRTAAWVWTRTHPERAATLFRTWRHSGVALIDPGASGTFQQWLARLRNDAEAVASIGRFVLEFIAAPKATRCRQAQATTSCTQLANIISALLRSEGVRE